MLEMLPKHFFALRTVIGKGSGTRQRREEFLQLIHATNKLIEVNPERKKLRHVSRNDSQRYSKFALARKLQSQTILTIL